MTLSISRNVFQQTLIESINEGLSDRARRCTNLPSPTLIDYSLLQEAPELSALKSYLDGLFYCLAESDWWQTLIADKDYSRKGAGGLSAVNRVTIETISNESQQEEKDDDKRGAISGRLNDRLAWKDAEYRMYKRAASGEYPKLFARRRLNIQVSLLAFIKGVHKVGATIPNSDLSSILPAPSLTDIPEEAIIKILAKIVPLLLGFARKPQLDSDEHCLYIRMWHEGALYKSEHAREKVFGTEDISELFPNATEICDIPIKRFWVCRYRNIDAEDPDNEDSWQCMFGEFADVEETLVNLKVKKFLIPVEGGYIVADLPDKL